MMENKENKSTVVTHAAFGAGKPVIPFSGRQFTSGSKSSDPSSCLRADRYPIPNSFEYRANPRERGIV